jgi:RNA polymerase sigma-70 factor (ECF subfamily)
MDEAGLIWDARKGDLDAFNRLVLAYQDIVYYQAFRLLGERQSAEDAAQTAFISAFQKLDTFRGGSFKAWMLRIVTNLCYDLFRREKSRPTVALEPLDQYGNEIESPTWLADSHALPEEIVEQTEIQERVQLAISNLSPKLRTVMVLVDLQALSYAEAAFILGISEGTVKSRLARARQKLRDLLVMDGFIAPAQQAAYGD